MNSMPSIRYRLSKSKIAAFEHCPRRLWLQIHCRHVAQFDAATLDRFRFGHEVGDKARFAVRDGTMVHAVPDIQAALARTAELIAKGPIHPIFEATFQHEDVLVRVDILEPDGKGGWRAIEVKASTRVRAHQLADLATQIWVMRGCGIAISSGVIRHIAGPFSWQRPDIAGVKFEDADVTMPLRRYIARRAKIIAAARASIRGGEVKRDTGPHCKQPFTCEFQTHCALHQSLPLFATG